MQTRSLGIALTTLLCGACFSPSDTLPGDPDAMASSGGAEPESEPDASNGVTTSAASGGDQGSSTGQPDPGGTTGGTEPEGGSSSGDAPAAEESGDEGTTGDLTGAESSTGYEDMGGESSESGDLTACLNNADCAGEAICRDAICRDADFLGHAEPFDDIGGLDGFLWGFPVELDEGGWLTDLGFIANGNGGSVQLSVYSDSSGAPFLRLATTDPVTGYIAGTHELPVEEQYLDAGTYWLMASAANPTRLAIDINNGQVNFPVSGIIRDFSLGHPNAIPEPNAFVNFRPNFFMRVWR